MEEMIKNKSLPKVYMKLALPVVFSMVISLVYNLADTFFISQTGNTDLVAGVSLCAPIFTMLMAFGNIYGQGGSSLIARLLGKKDAEGAKKVSSFCFYIAIATGLVIALLMFIFQNPILKAIGSNEGTLPYAKEYYLILAIGAPFCVLTFIHSNLLRSEGLSTESMIGTVGGSVINIILDPIFISVLGWGAAGAAIATVIGYIFTDIFFLAVVLKKSKYLSVKPSSIKIPGAQVGQIFGVGVTAAITNLASSLSLVLMNQALLPYGNEKIAAMGIVLKVSMIVNLIIVGFSFGGAPLFGYLYGSGDKKKLNSIIRFCLTFVGGLALGLSALVFIFAPQLIGIFLNTGSIVADGALMLRFQICTMVFVGILTLLTVVFQATGKVIPSFILSISRQGLVFIAVLFIASAVFGYTGVLAAQAVSDIISVLIAALLYLKVFRKDSQ